VVRSRQYKLFRERAHPQLIEMIEQKIRAEVEENFIQMAIHNHKRKEDSQEELANNGIRGHLKRQSFTTVKPITEDDEIEERL